MKRIHYLLLTLISIAAGLASRHYAPHLPDAIALYAGDTLWAAMVYFAVRLLLAETGVSHSALLALLFSYSIEFSQRYHPPWLDDLRQHWLGALILGRGFLWSDLACYATGIAMALVLDIATTRTGQRLQRG